MTWQRVFENPLPQGPFTIEQRNELTGNYQHRKASPYATLEEARARAEQEAQRSRKFVEFNVLDRKGSVVFSVRGVA